MYGLVNKTIEDMIRSRFGEESWQEIRQLAAVESDGSLSMAGYPDDATTDRLVKAGSTVLGLSASQIMQTFNEFWVQFTDTKTDTKGGGELVATSEDLPMPCDPVLPTQPSSSFTLSPEMLTTVFPFHFVLDRQLHIVQAGDVLQRICSGALIGCHLDQYFNISQPKVEMDFEAIQTGMKSVFLLESQHNGMCLKGQMIYSASEDLIFFLGSPWITEAENLNALGIELKDFAIHDPAVDLVPLLQSSKASLDKSKQLLADINQQKNQFRNALVIKENLARIAKSQSDRLQKTLRDLQKTQAQLVQTEKMSGLGQMVAGVAHEINNPVNFIHGNLKFAQQYTNTLLDLIALYQKKYPDINSDIEKFKEEVDYDFLSGDLTKMIDSMKIGTDRIREIVKSLRTFSRLDESEHKIVDIHDGIDSTLLILQHRIKETNSRPEIEIIKDYGELPKLECYAGQLNQVFMNLISNAIDALDEWGAKQTDQQWLDKSPQIKIITTLVNQNKLLIVIQDNGPGIPKEIQGRIFDPFFTTKPVGSGTGLGLSISYQVIVDKHAGNLFCRSELGQGAAFHIELSTTISRSQ